MHSWFLLKHLCSTYPGPVIYLPRTCHLHIQDLSSTYPGSLIYISRIYHLCAQDPKTCGQVFLRAKDVMPAYLPYILHNGHTHIMQLVVYSPLPLPLLWCKTLRHIIQVDQIVRTLYKISPQPIRTIHDQKMIRQHTNRTIYTTIYKTANEQFKPLCM